MIKKLSILSVIFLLSLPLSGVSQNIKVEGFRDLKWGMSVEDAQKIYPDLYMKYKNSDGRSFYFRQQEDKKIGESDFDEIKYIFKDNTFYKIIAQVEGPYLGLSKENFQEGFKPRKGLMELRKNIEAKYGPSTESSEKGAKDSAGMFKKREEVIWLIDNIRMELDYMEGYASDLYSRPSDKKNILWFSIEKIESTNLGF